jgi:hypothetical protein
MLNLDNVINDCNHNVLVIAQVGHTVYGNSLSQNAWRGPTQLRECGSDEPRRNPTYSVFLPFLVSPKQIGTDTWQLLPNTSHPPASIWRYRGARDEGPV